MLIREELENDWGSVYAVNVDAFGKTAEADLVNRLRQEARPLISLVAEVEGTNGKKIVGHALFSPVTLSGNDFGLMALGPIGVLSAYQRQGVGGALIEAGLERCRELGVPAVAVLGHSRYYPRFGFVPSVQFGIKSTYDVPAELFMMKELVSGSLKEKQGVIEYHEAFSRV